MESITKFQGDFRFLSNFYPVEIKYENLKYPSVEHAYQATKSLNPDVKLEISNLKKPGEAKKAGSNIKDRSNWKEINIQIMTDLLYIKFSQDPLKMMLLNTGDSYLIEGNWWHDNFWGICECEICGKGNIRKNNLGKILMLVREKIKKEKI